MFFLHSRKIACLGIFLVLTLHYKSEYVCNVRIGLHFLKQKKQLECLTLQKK
jgi:hypothetical protein